MLRVSERQAVRAAGGVRWSSGELGEMLCSVSCRGVVVIMPDLQSGDPRFEPCGSTLLHEENHMNSQHSSTS